MGQNLASIVTAGAERAAEDPAIRLGDVELSYGSLDDRSARLATLLRERGLEPGDRVGVMLPNVPSSRSPTTGCCARAGSSSR